MTESIRHDGRRTTADRGGRSRNPVTRVVAIALSAVIGLVVDLDRPSGGLIRTNQQPLVDLRNSLERH